MAEHQKVEVQHDWTTEMWDWPMQHADGVVRLINTAEKFEADLECPFFTPNEIDVKIMGTDLSIRCYHEERSDQFGTIKREINRCYHLPPDLDKASLKTNLSPKGILIITANKMQA